MSSCDVSRDPTIALPDDPEKKDKLERKVRQYRNRLKRKLSPSSRLDLKNKLAIASLLLENGRVEYAEVKALRGSDKHFSEYELLCDFSVIACYIAHDGEHVSRFKGPKGWVYGWGLPETKK